MAESPENLEPNDSPSSICTLEYLRNIDMHSAEFVAGLSSMLNSDDISAFVSKLQEEVPITIIDFLDKALDSLPKNSNLHRRCLRSLRRICGITQQLPSSHFIDGLFKPSANPVVIGTFSELSVGFHLGTKVAIRSLRVNPRDDRAALHKMFCEEVVIWKRLSHPNVLPLLGVSTMASRLCKVNDWMENGDIVNYLKANPCTNRLDMLLDVSKGIEYLHSIEVIHGDLKGSNILIDKNLRARLTDFELASISSNNPSMPTQSGTLRWMAPELLGVSVPDNEAGRRTKASDVYAFAMVVIEIFTGNVPFHEYRTEMAIFKMWSGSRPKRPTEASELGLTDEVWDMTCAAWKDGPDERPSISEVVDCLALVLLNFVYDSRAHLVAPQPPASTTPVANLSSGSTKWLLESLHEYAVKSRVPSFFPTSKEYTPINKHPSDVLPPLTPELQDSFNNFIGSLQEIPTSKQSSLNRRKHPVSIMLKSSISALRQRFKSAENSPLARKSSSTSSLRGSENPMTDQHHTTKLNPVTGKTGPPTHLDGDTRVSVQYYELMRFINGVDVAIDSSYVDLATRTRWLRWLGRICDRTGVLPSSHILKHHVLQVHDGTVAAGGFSEVSRGTYDGLPVAVKTLKMYSKEDQENLRKNFCKEAVVWKRLSHPNIVPFLGVSTEFSSLQIVSRWMPYLTVRKYVRQDPAVNRLKLLVDVSSGIRYLHSQNVIHGDVKGDNILVDNRGNARICDFGLATLCVISNTVPTTPESNGSTRWMAPELFDVEEGESHDAPRPTPASDIYALSMVAIEVFTGKIPFEQLRNEVVMFRSLTGLRPERPHDCLELGLSDLVWEVMSAGWVQDPSRRPGIESFLTCFQ